MSTVRVATTQFSVGNDVQANLNKWLDFIDKAADGGARLVVGPEFGNHTSFYTDINRAWDVAIEIGGEYVKAVKERAKARNIFVVFNATRRGENAPTAYITNFLIGPDGELIGIDDKQVLMGGEAQFLSSSQQPGKVFETAIGRIGMMSCLDGVPPETARNLALKGAQIITNSHNSCALDEPYGHIPVRAAENRVPVIAAGKVGVICVDEMLAPLADMVGVPQHILSSLGENPILDRQGKAVAQLPTLEEGIIFANIDLNLSEDKSWADGNLFEDRRPELYTAIIKPSYHFSGEAKPPIEGAIIQVRSDRPLQDNIDRALDLVADAAQNDARLIVLPELCIFDKAQLVQRPQLAMEESEAFEQRLSDQCKQLGIHVAASLITEDDGLRHTGVLIGDQGERIAQYHQTHLPESFKSWCKPGDELEVFDTPIGRIGFMLGYDGVFPETASVLARKGAEIIVHPTAWNFEWEVRLIIPERAAENRVNILSAARADSAVKRGGLINALAKSQPLRARDLNPIWPIEAPHDRECHISKMIFPLRARDKDLLGFDLQKGRRTELYSRLVEA